jgi:hypothetical protein
VPVELLVISAQAHISLEAEELNVMKDGQLAEDVYQVAEFVTAMAFGVVEAGIISRVSTRHQTKKML